MKWSNRWFVIIVVIVFVIAAGTLIIEGQHKKNTPTTSVNNNKTSIINNAIVVTKYNSLVGNYLATPAGQTQSRPAWPGRKRAKRGPRAASAPAACSSTSRS